MTVIIKLPNQNEYLNVKLICGFRLAEPTDEHKGHRVFIDQVIGNNVRSRWVLFKTEKTAKNFCATLKRKIDNSNGR